jgi:hypothetical protein
MIDRITIEDLRRLGDLRDAICVSFYLPLYVSGNDGPQDAVRLRRILNQAEEQLIAGGMQRYEAEQLTERARTLADNSAFWDHRSDGLAVFLTSSVFYAYRLPFRFKESLTVGRRMNVKPLLGVADRGERFYLLTLSENHVRLFDVRRWQIDEIKDLSQPMRSALHYTYIDQCKQVHSGRKGGSGREAAVFHGQGGAPDVASDELAQFSEWIDGEIRPLLGDAQIPLLLAGVKKFVPIFRRHCSYSHLVEEHLTGNFDRATPGQLHERSWEVMRSFFEKNRQEALARLRQEMGTGLASADPAEVMNSAVAGRVEVLFADPETSLTGAAGDDRSVGANSAKSSNTDDLINVAAIETMLHRGTVVTASANQLPDGTPLAAIYRY